METEQRCFEYKGAEGNEFEGYLAMPKNRAGSLPGVLIFHAFGGCGKFEKGRAQELAKLGYVALAADVYGKGRRGTTFDENCALMAPCLDDRNGFLKKNLLAAFEALKNVSEVDGNRIGAVGYCFGGLCSLDVGRHNFGARVVISFHGLFTPLPETPLDQIGATVQMHHGDADFHMTQGISLEQAQQEFRDRGADWSLLIYSKAGHAFTDPEKEQKPGIGYNKEADIRSWAAATALLREKLMNE